MNYEPIIEQFFETRGFDVEKIPKMKGSESSDFLVKDDTSSSIVELKTKFPSADQIRERRSFFEAGKIHVVKESIERKNRLSGVIEKAQSQIAASKHDEGHFGLAWFFCAGHLADPRMNQFEATLYGSADLVVGENPSRALDCYFFHNSDFFRYRGILDAAIVSATVSAQELRAKLLLNPLSPRYHEMKNSSLVKKLGIMVIDPIELESNGNAFLVDGDINRNDKSMVLDYLKEKYHVEVVVEIPMIHLSGTMTLPE